MIQAAKQGFFVISIRQDLIAILIFIYSFDGNTLFCNVIFAFLNTAKRAISDYFL